MKAVQAPDGWSTVPLRTLATINYGRDPSPILAVDGEYPVYGTSDDQRWGIDYLFDGESIILGRKGSIDRVRFARGKFWTIDTAYFLSDFNDVSPEWLYYCLEQLDLRSLNEATGVPSLSRDTLYRIELPKPARPEQDRIASVLATVDKAIRESEKLLAKYARIKTGVLQDLFTRGVDENGALRSEQKHEFVDSPIGRIPREWELSTLGRHAGFASGYAFKEHELSEDGWRVVRISNLHKPDFPYWHYDGQPRPSWIVKPGDVVFSWAGVASSIDCVQYQGSKALLNQHIYNLSFSSEESKLYTYFFLQSYLPRLRTEIEGGAGQLHLTKAKIRAIPIPVPSPRERDNTVAVLMTAEATVSGYRREIAKLERLKRGLMRDLLSGTVRTRDTPELEEVTA